MQMEVYESLGNIPLGENDINAVGRRCSHVHTHKDAHFET